MLKKELLIVEEIHPNLGIKGGAQLFFNYVKTLPEDEILINFEGSEFMSRSFAQEYLKQKGSINKKIEEIKVPENVRSMLELVKNSCTPNPKKILENI